MSIGVWICLSTIDYEYLEAILNPKLSSVFGPGIRWLQSTFVATLTPLNSTPSTLSCLSHLAVHTLYSFQCGEVMFSGRGLYLDYTKFLTDY